MKVSSKLTKNEQKVMQKCFNNTFLKGEGINKFEKCVSHHVRKDIKEVADAGADTFVSGSAIFNQPDYTEIIQKMRDSLKA